MAHIIDNNEGALFNQGERGGLKSEIQTHTQELRRNPPTHTHTAGNKGPPEFQASTFPTTQEQVPIRR